MSAETKTNNRLWQARRKSGLEQKQVAYLLGHKNIDQISRYERGEKTPSLKNALKLELILRVPISDLFPEQYQCCRKEIGVQSPQRKLTNSGEAQNRNLKDSHVCTYGNSLLQKKPTKDEIDIARTHTIHLMRKVGDAIYNR